MKCGREIPESVRSGADREVARSGGVDPVLRPVVAAADELGECRHPGLDGCVLEGLVEARPAGVRIEAAGEGAGGGGPVPTERSQDSKAQRMSQCFQGADVGDGKVAVSAMRRTSCNWPALGPGSWDRGSNGRAWFGLTRAISTVRGLTLRTFTGLPGGVPFVRPNSHLSVLDRRLQAPVDEE